MIESTVPVQITGWGWNTAFLLLLNIIGGGIGVALIKRKPALNKIANEREANLLHERAAEMDSMRDRMKAMESRLEKQAAEHRAEKLAWEARIEERERLYEADMALARHRVNNLDQSLQALLMLIEQDPAKAAEAAAKVRKMREEQLVREATEKATIYSSKIATVTTTTQTSAS